MCIWTTNFSKKHFSKKTVLIFFSQNEFFTRSKFVGAIRSMNCLCSPLGGHSTYAIFNRILGPFDLYIFQNWNHSIYTWSKCFRTIRSMQFPIKNVWAKSIYAIFVTKFWGHSIYAIFVTNGKKLPFLFLKNLSNRCLNFHSKGGNAAQFLQTFVRPKLKSMLTSFKQRQMLPNFPRERAHPNRCFWFSGSKGETLPIFSTFLSQSVS